MKVVCLGDSLTYGFGLRRSEVWTRIVENQLHIKMINKGICGDTTGGMLTRYFNDVYENRPTHVFIMGGTNDFIMEAPIGVVKANISTMVHYSLTYNIKPIMGIQIPKDMEVASEMWPGLTDFNRVNRNIEEYRQWVLGFSQLFNLAVVDFYDIFDKLEIDKRKDLYLDGLHLTTEGNIIMANAFIEVIESKF